MSSILERLAIILEQRKTADPTHSYVAKLYAQGLDAILKKVAEETAEVLLAAKDGDSKHLQEEVADLWFHCLVLLAQQGLKPEMVLMELERRFGHSGLKDPSKKTQVPKK